MYEGQRDQLYQQQFNLDQVAFTTESVKDTVNTVQALKGAHKELKTQMKKKEFDIDKIEKLQDDMTDLMVGTIIPHEEADHMFFDCHIFIYGNASSFIVHNHKKPRLKALHSIHEGLYFMSCLIT